ncbi:MAG TPA: SBBP repeat-containing protein [Terriglobia bacterium]|nr:SBBP repeat-containing protein [Terriglobia bacterium]
MNPLQPALKGPWDAFVTKINSSGTGLVYSTYLGGTGSDWGAGLAVDAAGNAYVAGRTDSPDFPTANAFQNAFHGGTFDGFLAKLNPSGSALVFSTYFGGSGWEEITALALDRTGNIYVGGPTESQDLPITAEAYQRQLSCRRPDIYIPQQDLFFTKFNPAATALLYSTYFGGGGEEWTEGLSDIDVDGAGYLYAVGATTSYQFPGGGCTGEPPTGYAIKLSTSRPELVYGGCFGRAPSTSGAVSVAADSLGRAYVALDDRTTADISKARLLRFGTSGGVEVDYPGLNGNRTDTSYAVAVDNADRVYVAGLTMSSDFPTKNAAQPALKGTSDGFVVKIDFSDESGFTRQEQNSSAVQYAGDWYTSDQTMHSGCSAFRATAAGSRVRYTFTGTEARWIGYRDSSSGTAKVYVDGELKATVDTHAGAAQAQAVMFTTDALPSGTHTLAIEVQASWVWVDAFEYVRD